MKSNKPDFSDLTRAKRDIEKQSSKTSANIQKVQDGAKNHAPLPANVKKAKGL